MGTGNHHALRRAQHRRGFDKMHLRGKAKARGHLQAIARQCAAPGAQLHIEHRFGLTAAHPDVGQPHADHLAEHLADLRRGDEVSGTAQRIAARVIAGIGLAHILREGDRPGGGDQAAEAIGKGGRLHASPAAKGGRISARTTSASPIRIIGMVSHWPIDMPVRRANSCNCASGSRKNSTVKRAKP